jgi:outer membrane lipoprotein-sorting protein
LNKFPNHRAAHADSRSPGTGRKLRRSALALAMMMAADSAGAVVAQTTIPLPRPAPKARTVASRAATTTGSADTALVGTPKPSQPVPTPILPDPRRRVAAFGTPTLDATQRAQVSKVSAYLSSLNTLVGNFVQIAPNGARTTGNFYMQKPGKVRFEYDPPSQIAIVADGTSVIVRDQKLATQDVYPLSQTPLRFLLSDRIDLLRDTNLVSVTSDDVFISVTIEESQPLIGTSRLMLMLGAKDNQLKQWTVTDPQGYDTTVAVYNLDSTKKLDPNMFKIDYTNYGTPPG